MGDTPDGLHITHTMLVTWQTDDPVTRDIIDNGLPDNPARNNVNTAEKNNEHVFTDGLLRIILLDYTPVIIPKHKVQNVLWTYHD